MKTDFVIAILLFPYISLTQPINQPISQGLNKLQNDEQFKHAIISFTVADGNTGKIIFEKNGEQGMVPASCLKVITSVTAFELLGKDFRYKTMLGYDGNITNDHLDGNIYLVGSGDPTFGSWRWKETDYLFISQKIQDELKRLHIHSAKSFVIDNSRWGTEWLPRGWVWEDIGNYYGAGCSSFTWHENEYDIVLKPGRKEGDPVTVLSGQAPGMTKLVNELNTGSKGTGDQSIVYYAPFSTIGFIRGTIPLGMDSFIVKASTADGSGLFLQQILPEMIKAGLRVGPSNQDDLQYHAASGKMESLIYTFISPSFDSINYWFLKKSLNIFGEASLKTIAYEQTNIGSTDTGVSIVKRFWSKLGIEKSSLKIIDGSGLSPSNRVTTNSLVKVMLYAKSRPWFDSFYYALPEMNGIKMKDGYISGTRSYAGYLRNKSGQEYVFSFIVNNFDGDPAIAREKIWKVLNIMK